MTVHLYICGIAGENVNEFLKLYCSLMFKSLTELMKSLHLLAPSVFQDTKPYLNLITVCVIN